MIPNYYRFNRKLAKKWILGQFWGQFFPPEVPKVPWSCHKCFYDILERYHKSFFSNTSLIISKHYRFFRKLAKKWIFGQFWGLFFPPEGPKSSWFCRKYFWNTLQGPFISFSLVLSHIFPKYCLFWRNWGKKTIFVPFWDPKCPIFGTNVNFWIFK